MSQFKHVHIIGVCGTLMGSFASYLKRQGVRVTGSDQNVYPPMSEVLQAAGVELFSPYSAENVEKIKGKPDLVVVGNVISRGNSEMIAFQERNYPYLSLPEFMEKHLLPFTQNLVVAGTHGKTTTSSFLAQTLVHLGRENPKWKPSYFIGGVSQSLPYSFHVQEGGKFFVLEGDEYDTAFWDKVPKFNHYLPDSVILTSVEYDHADIYPNLEAVVKAFSGLIERIRPQGTLIACIENENVRKLLQLESAKKIKVLTYGRKEQAPQADFYFQNLRQNEIGGVDFEVMQSGSSQPLGQLSIHLPGEHNALNALAVCIQGLQLGLTFESLQQGLLSFKGVKRRQEERGTVHGVLVIDDFAHHPTAVKETLKALKEKYKNRKLIAVFEPRSATSRRKVFQREYAEAFRLADEIFIAEAFDQSKIPSEQQFSSAELVEDLKKSAKAAHLFTEVDDGVREVSSKSCSGDVVAVLSNGGFGGFIPKLLDQLKQKS